MASTTKVSTGLTNQLAGNRKSLRDLMKDCILNLYSGAVPTDADNAVTGTLVATITRSGLSSKVAQVMRITPATAGTTGTWSVTINGETVIFTDDGTPTVAEVCTGLTNLLNVMNGGAITTPPGVFNTENDGVFTVTNNTTSVDVTAAVAGVLFEISATATGAGNSLTVSTQTADAYGLHWEAYTDITSGELEKLATESWQGTALVDANPITYGRFVKDGDTSGLSTTDIRIQDLVGVANTGIIVSHVDVTAGEIITVSGYKLKVKKYQSA